MTPTVASEASAIHGVASAASSALQGAAAAVATAPGWFESGSLSFEFVKGMPTTIVAIIVAVIAWRQYRVAEELKRVARAKLNFDLFVRRLKIFEATWTTLSDNAFQADYGREDSNAFRNMIPEAGFLFGPEIEDYLRLISAKVAAFRSNAATQHEEGTNAENGLVRDELQGWFWGEASACRGKFGKYLDFSEWR